MIISIRILENILVPRYTNCFTSQFSSVKLTFPFTKTFLIFTHTHNTNLINCIRRKRKFSPLPFCNVKWITLTVIEFPINIKQFYILFQSLRALSCSKWTNEYMCGNRFSIYEPEFFGDITTSTFGTIGEIHLNTDDLIRFFFEVNRITNGLICVFIFVLLCCCFANRNISWCETAKHAYANSSDIRMKKGNAEKRNKVCLTHIRKL